ncbi:MAG TPA: NIL domain-containing protein [Dehalococcoidia bacterium]|nr:FeS-binding protein [Chloroflexota bacterium]MDP5876065.1 NIL domain-containing protein [Dehalococcoidia bacterium]MDP6274431.1 NIL domain-containing protein [Dehalococcoidia bacterium]MDP7160635.1 NIL domain-containing protein [Dehalococcoidia bacterium]MDP7213681.1 NIL domain-containing protein [Dehalococcoidia bacterium]
MGIRRVRLTFEGDQITDPVIYQLGKDFEIVTNIRRAEVHADVGWVILELDGAEAEIDLALAWASGKGVRVDPLAGDVIEG